MEKKERKNERKRDKKRPGWSDRQKKVIGITGGVILVIALLYLGIAFYFRSHYFFRTEINGHNVSGRSVSAAEQIFADDVASYELELLEMNGAKETVSGADISMKYEKCDDAEKILEEQNVFLWPGALFKKPVYEASVEISYDDEQLQTKIDSLQVVTAEQTQPVSAYPKYDGEKFVIEPEQYGTAVQTDVLREEMERAFAALEETLDLKAAGCYASPSYTAESPEVQQACDVMNKYCEARIVYPMTEEVVIDKSVISGWLTTDENMQVVISEEAVRGWLQEFGDTYDTVGTTRTFTTPTGKQATVSGGTYGWSINEKAEYDVIIDAVQNSKVLEREPEYYNSGHAAVHGMPDWGSTYIDVDLSEQYMWYVVDGSVALETDVVTGRPTPERITPEGTYSIVEKERNRVLKGSVDPATGKPSYETPVNYWMRVTWSGIGFHDATWQPAFGGTLNQTRGSHGCINMPYDKAAQLYEMVEMGTPVVIHY